MEGESEMSSSVMPAVPTSQEAREFNFQKSESDWPQRYRVVRGQGDRPSRDGVLSGQLTQMNLFSILQTLAANNSTGNLLVHGNRMEGSIYTQRGQLIYVSLGRHQGPKAFYRLMDIQEGKFEFFSPGRQPGEYNMAGSLEWHLLEAARHIDELTVLRDQLPDGSAHLRFNPKMIATVARIPYPMLEVMAAIHKHETLAGTLDGSSMPDLDACRILKTLLINKVVLVVPE